MKNSDERRTVYIDASTWGALQILAGRKSAEEGQHVSVAELIRRSVQLYLSENDI